MKNTIKTFLGVLVVITFTSCVTDYQGQIPDEAEFTATNYIYEGDLYKYYLEEQISNANNQTSDNQLNFWKKELNNIINLEKLGLDLIPPIPPCPTPNECGYEDLEYLLVDSKAEKVEVIFYDSNDKAIGGGTIDLLSPLPDAKGLINFANLKIENYNDNLYSIKVEVFENNKVTRSYLVK
ncbi:hypothetical protein ABN763_14240 [Spongiivirga sp. MCCC 1A20706]|uniref:hypothetical protein n=1 Tax=Spongiivirga sp. MCCC 1A20706 TaxID=3160963 RepID=UPI003977A7B8